MSSRIEGTECTLDDIIAYDLSPIGPTSLDVGEVVNYVAALGHGIGRLSSLPLSNRLLREVHEYFSVPVAVQTRRPVSSDALRTGWGTQAAHFPKPVSCRHQRMS